MSKFLKKDYLKTKKQVGIKKYFMSFEIKTGNNRKF